MCGIVAYIGNKKSSHILINGLQRLEYRGYDSAGLAFISEDSKLQVFKNQGKVKDLDRLIDHKKINSHIGIAHTRWATHGVPNNTNAHPHYDNSKNIALVHNGIIENYTVLRTKLIEKGYTFESQTDTEVLAVLIGAIYEQTKDLESAVRNALIQVEGTFGIAVVSSYEPDKIITARRGSPMVLGIGENEFILASDASAIIQHTRQVIYLDDNEMAIITKNHYFTKTIYNVDTNSEIQEILYNLDQIEKGGFDYFMLKEIHEQPISFENTFRGRLLVDEGNVKLGGLRNIEDKLRNAEKIIITACGTSWNAALVAEYLIENLARIPVEVEYASEFRYRNPVINQNDIVFAISQSGETADTLAAIKEAKQKGALCCGIVNAVGSSIARETEAGIYIHAGPEIGVASTKAFTSQLCAFTLLSLYLGRMRNLSSTEGMNIAKAITQIPSQIEEILQNSEQIKKIAVKYSKSKNYIYLGRGYNYPVALEGALKLKEISYIHAEGYPSAEMKHGPIALIDENMPVVFIATRDEIYDKVKSNIQEVLARKGKIIAIANYGDTELAELTDDIIYIPKTLPMLTPVLSVIPLQLLAYYTALELGRDVDRPRNLAKSVTVE